MSGRLFFLASALLLGACASPYYTPDGDSRDVLQALLSAPDVPPAVAETAPPLDLAGLERAVSEEVNRVRQESGLRPLAWNGALARAARAHSSDMAESVYFSHQARDGCSSTERAAREGVHSTAQRGGVDYEGVGENLYLAHRFREYRVLNEAGRSIYETEWKREDEIARHAVATWMQSRTHRANLLSPLYEAQAIGAATGEGATIFITQNLALAR